MKKFLVGIGMSAMLAVANVSADFVSGDLQLRDAMYLYDQGVDARGSKTLGSSNCDVFQLVLDVTSGYTDLVMGVGNANPPNSIAYPDRIHDSAAMFAYALTGNDTWKVFGFNDKANLASSAQIGKGTIFGYCYSTKPDAYVYFSESDKCTVKYSNGSRESMSNCVTAAPLAPMVSTFVGTGRGFVNGAGTVASFNYPYSVAVDSSGNMFVADNQNNAIRKITPTGIVSTFAGNGTGGFTNGTGTDASFRTPYGVAVDSSGNVFVADWGNGAIRKITPAGVVSTFAGGGGGSDRFIDGTGTAARFDEPSGVAVDNSGNVYVADTWNQAIRKITPEGVVSTFAGGSYGFTNGTGTAASFNYPMGVAVDSSGNVFVADSGNRVIRKISPAGVVSTFAGSGSGGSTNGTGTEASFWYPRAVSVDSRGNVYVADSDNHAIRKITPASVVSTLAGGGGYGFTNGSGIEARFQRPYGVVVDSSGNVYVADSDNHVIRKITP